MRRIEDVLKDALAIIREEDVPDDKVKEVIEEMEEMSKMTSLEIFAQENAIFKLNERTDVSERVRKECEDSVIDELTNYLLYDEGALNYDEIDNIIDRIIESVEDSDEDDEDSDDEDSDEDDDDDSDEIEDNSDEEDDDN